MDVLFRAFALPQHSTLLLTISKALEYIAACESADLAVIGIEGFYVVNQFIQPQVNMILDNSPTRFPISTWINYRTACNQFAVKFLNELPTHPNLVVEIVAVGIEELNF